VSRKQIWCSMTRRETASGRASRHPLRTIARAVGAVAAPLEAERVSVSVEPLRLRSVRGPWPRVGRPLAAPLGKDRNEAPSGQGQLRRL
jgi:hypothetical protein